MSGNGCVDGDKKNGYEKSMVKPKYLLFSLTGSQVACVRIATFFSFATLSCSL